MPQRLGLSGSAGLDRVPYADGEPATWPCPVVGAAPELPECSYRSTGSKYRMGLPSPIAISISLRVLSLT